MGTLLEARGLTKIFRRADGRETTAVRQVSFRLEEGETLGIVGESGCGKSTLARLLTGLVRPTEGTVLLEGEDLTGAGGRAWRSAYRKMQMVFQSPAGSFDPRRTVGDGVGESLRNAGMPETERRRRVGELLGLCGLEAETAERYPGEISGGQCQRAAIARALAAGPKLLICDEATSALDVTVQRQIMNLLDALRREKGLSFLFISHNLALVQSFCSRVLVMHGGTVVEEGPPDRLIRAPASPYTKRLVDAAL